MQIDLGMRNYLWQYSVLCRDRVRGKALTLEGPVVVSGPASGLRYCFGIRGCQPAACADLNIDENYYIEDLHSRNGTYVNGKLLTGRQLLNENDEIGICELSFVFHSTPPQDSDDACR